MTGATGMSLRNYAELIWYRGLAELHAEVARAYLGFIWWFLEPILYMGIFYFIFATGLRGGGLEFAPFLLCGLVSFKWFASSVNRVSQWEKGNLGIIQQVYVPKLVFMLTGMFTNFLKFLIILAILIVFLLVIGKAPDVYWLAFPALLITEFLLIFGLGVFLGSITPMVPDLRNIIENLMTMLFFISGIFFDIHQFPEPYRSILYINPMVSVIDAFRDVFMRSAWPDWQSLAIISVVSLFLGLFGMARCRKLDRLYPRYTL